MASGTSSRTASTPGVRLGESVDKDMIAVRIGPDWRLVAVASPDYFARASRRRTIPSSWSATTASTSGTIRSGGLYVWEFEKGGRELRVRVDGQFIFNTSYAQIDAAVAGYGIAYLPENLVERELASGELDPGSRRLVPMFAGYYLYYPSRRQNSPAFSVIVAALRMAA